MLCSKLLRPPADSAACLIPAFVPGFDVDHQILPGRSREASHAVTVLPGNRDGKPELPQRLGVHDPAEGDTQVQL